ncbi:hypothetical protein PR003_g14780 [Phytophthora rubi]|nr:hypothetical protein PR002_g12799 [Phytophthora rubi]KAE9331899.1 hypothetical protein PR003_g14780 [Phytophthora rubi]
MAAALQDLTAVVASIQAGDGRRTEPEGARRGRQRAAGGGGPPSPPSSDSEVSSDSDSEGGGCGRRVQYGDDARERAVQAVRRTTT